MNVWLGTWVIYPAEFLWKMTLEQWTRPPWWLRVPMFLAALIEWRRTPEWWLVCADALDAHPVAGEAWLQSMQRLGGELIARELRDGAERVEPGIQRRRWEEKRNAAAVAELQRGSLKPRTDGLCPFDHQPCPLVPPPG